MGNFFKVNKMKNIKNYQDLLNSGKEANVDFLLTKIDNHFCMHIQNYVSNRYEINLKTPMDFQQTNINDENIDNFVYYIDKYPERCIVVFTCKKG